MSSPDEREQFVNTLVELVQEKSVTWSEALRMYRTEYSASLLECKHFGVIDALQRAGESAGTSP